MVPWDHHLSQQSYKHLYKANPYPGLYETVSVAHINNWWETHHWRMRCGEEGSVIPDGQDKEERFCVLESLREQAGIRSEILRFTPIFTPLFLPSLPFSYICVAYFDLWLYTRSLAFRPVNSTRYGVIVWPSGLVVTSACPFNPQIRINFAVHLCLPITTTHVK